MRSYKIFCFFKTRHGLQIRANWGEVLGYNFQSNHEKKYIEEICRNLPIIELERKIVETVIQIKQKRKIKLPDAIIFATAMVHQLELMTANVDDFTGIDKTVVITNPLTDQKP